MKNHPDDQSSIFVLAKNGIDIQVVSFYPIGKIAASNIKV